MIDPYTGLNDRFRKLGKWQDQAMKGLAKAPKGKLYVRRRGKNDEWYYVPEHEEQKSAEGAIADEKREEHVETRRREIYLKKKQEAFARKLAQRDYYKKVLQAVRKEIRALRGFALSLPGTRAEMVYENLPEGRKNLVIPLLLSDADYVREWQKMPYLKKPMSEEAPIHLTAGKERVRSKSEVLIADTLDRLEYPYRYEQQIVLGGRRFHPDFVVLDPVTRKEYYWEHLGRIDDPAYARDVVERLQYYAKYGIFPGTNLILSWETAQHPLNTDQIETLTRHYFSHEN